MSQGAAIRRRRQWAIKHKHIAKLGRPIHHTMSVAKSARRLQELIQRQRAMQGRKKGGS